MTDFEGEVYGIIFLDIKLEPVIRNTLSKEQPKNYRPRTKGIVFKSQYEHAKLKGIATVGVSPKRSVGRKNLKDGTTTWVFGNGIRYKQNKFDTDRNCVNYSLLNLEHYDL